jgi:formamidopyrimidine-DNA glycosylase
VRSAIRKGGAHTGRFVATRGPEGVCPRDGTPLSKGVFGGRTTYWCPACQL